MNNITVVSEYVGFGHPDKVADQVSDALLDAFLRQDEHTRAGIEVMVKDNIVVLGGEVKTQGCVDCDAVVRQVFAQLPYPASHHLAPDDIKVINLLGRQSPEISQGVDQSSGLIGAGDQGFCVGMATNETPDYLPLGVHVAKKICQHIAEDSALGFGPDCKSQVIVNYDQQGRATIGSILVSTMHQGDLDTDRKTIADLISHNHMHLDPQLFSRHFQSPRRQPTITVNPCGIWRMGGSISDCGITGRKIVVDQFGGYCPVGGGNLGGKDMSKIDRSAAYMCRFLAKNIVAAGLADTAQVELSYMIGIPHPSSIHITMDKNQHLVSRITQWITTHIDLSPQGIISRFDGSYPRYYHLSRYGHYGKTSKELTDGTVAKYYPWELTIKQ